MRRFACVSLSLLYACGSVGSEFTQRASYGRDCSFYLHRPISIVSFIRDRPTEFVSPYVEYRVRQLILDQTGCEEAESPDSSDWRFTVELVKYASSDGYDRAVDAVVWVDTDGFLRARTVMITRRCETARICEPSEILQDLLFNVLSVNDESPGSADS